MSGDNWYWRKDSNLMTGELATFMDKYQKQECGQYSVQRSKTISAANVQRKINDCLIYYSLHYACKYSGIYKTKGKGLRKAVSMKTNCPAFILIRASKNGKFLEVIDLNIIPNHPPGDTSLKEPSEAIQSEMQSEATANDVDVVPEIQMLGLGGGDTSNPSELDICNLSLYIALEAVCTQKPILDLQNIQHDMTLPVISSAGIPCNLKLIKAKMRHLTKETSDFEKCKFEDQDLVAILDSSEFLDQITTEGDEVEASFLEASIAGNSKGSSQNDVTISATNEEEKIRDIGPLPSAGNVLGASAEDSGRDVEQCAGRPPIIYSVILKSRKRFYMQIPYQNLRIKFLIKNFEGPLVLEL